MITETTYTPAGLPESPITPGGGFDGATYVGGNQPIETIVNIFLLNQDGSFILNQDESKIIVGTMIKPLLIGGGLIAGNYLAGSMI
jgi:hypothetical protein